MITAARLTLVTLLAFQAPQTPAQLVNQIDALVKQLQALLAAPAPAPPPPAVVKVNTLAELTVALQAKAPRIFMNPGIYTANVVLVAPVVLEGTLQTVVTPADPLAPTFTIASSGVSIVGMDIKCGPRDCVVGGDLAATDASTQPDAVIIDGNTIEADPAKGGKRGVALHGTNMTVRGNRIVNFWLAGQDSQGVWGNNGAGPYTIVDNYIEASGENILFGGDDPGIAGVVPSDILIRGNTLVKPASYKTNGASVKNNLELKNARRVTIQGNIIDGWWPAGQGAAVQFTPRNQDGKCPWCVVEDVTFTGNTVKNAPLGFAINILGTDNDKPSQQTKRITIARNLFADSQSGIQVLGFVEGALVIDHNTFPGIKTKLFSFDTLPSTLTPLTFTNNVAKGGTYAITGDGNQSFGLPSLLAFCTLTDWSGNIIAETFANGKPAHTWPAGQTVTTLAVFPTLLDPATFKLLNGTAGY